ncbi:polysaccharide pyruvyl transferase WcaK-like protein [Bradyrhizobium sp. USDA 4469]
MGKLFGADIKPDVVCRYDNPAASDVIGLGEHDNFRREPLRQRPLVMSGGGIIENNANAVIFRCASLLRPEFTSKAHLFGISVEPGVTYNLYWKLRLLTILRKFDVIYTRDEISRAVLSNMFPSMDVRTVGDLVLWLQPDFTEHRDMQSSLGKYIAVNLAPRWTGDANWHRWILEELIQLARTLDAALVFVPMTSEFDDDRAEHRILRDGLAERAPDVRCVLIESLPTPRGAAALFGCAHLAISMRLHGCVMAYAQQTPCVGLGYHPKLAGFFRTVGLEATMLPDDLPRVQTKGTYGFRFADLTLPRGALVERAMNSFSDLNFSALPTLKNRSAAVLAKILGLSMRANHHDRSEFQAPDGTR